mgnify:CR=1 FL=1
MKKNTLIFCFLVLLSACQTVSDKINENINNEEQNMSKYLNKTEEDLKIVFGKPDEISFKKNSSNRFYIYKFEKLKIKCQRTFEINKNDKIVGFSSKNCF